MKLCRNLPKDTRLQCYKKLSLPRIGVKDRWKILEEEFRWKLELKLSSLYVVRDIMHWNSSSSCKPEKEQRNS